MDRPAEIKSRVARALDGDGSAVEWLAVCARQGEGAAQAALDEMGVEWRSSPRPEWAR